MKNKPIHRKWRKSLIFYQQGTIIEEELTFDKFINGLQSESEYFFVYDGTSIDIAFHYEKHKKIFELNINGYCDNAERYSFATIDELIHSKLIDGKSIIEVWDKLTN